jgi:hypothetical protein
MRAESRTALERGLSHIAFDFFGKLLFLASEKLPMANIIAKGPIEKGLHLNASL